MTTSSRRGDVGFVLVHGAGHGAWCWEEIEPALQALGHRTDAVDLPMTSLRDDASVVPLAVEAMRRRTDRVVLVGHSYGGAVVSVGGHEADHLVFVAGVLPDTGQTPAELQPRLVTSHLAASMRVLGDSGLSVFDPERAVPAFYSRCSPEQQRRAVARLRPLHRACVTEAVERPAWRQVRSTYVVCTDDSAMLESYQRECGRSVGDCVSVDADHSPFYSATGALADVLHRTALRLTAGCGRRST
jgi:pimeloyl-ACP methyl ester carboxylesterase